jgi:hypothetical protein
MGSLVTDATAKHIYGLQYAKSPVSVYYLSPAYKILFPIKDLFLALSFAYLYYYQGMKNLSKKEITKTGKLKKIKGEGINFTTLLIDEPEETMHSFKYQQET